MAEYTIKFRPLERETLALMLMVNENEKEDPVAVYGRLISAAVMAGALLELMPDAIAAHARQFSENAHMAVKEHPEIFGALIKN